MPFSTLDSTTRGSSASSHTAVSAPPFMGRFGITVRHQFLPLFCTALVVLPCAGSGLLSLFSPWTALTQIIAHAYRSPSLLFWTSAVPPAHSYASSFNNKFWTQFLRTCHHFTVIFFWTHRPCVSDIFKVFSCLLTRFGFFYCRLRTARPRMDSLLDGRSPLHSHLFSLCRFAPAFSGPQVLVLVLSRRSPVASFSATSLPAFATHGTHHSPLHLRAYSPGYCTLLRTGRLIPNIATGQDSWSSPHGRLTLDIVTAKRSRDSALPLHQRIVPPLTLTLGSLASFSLPSYTCIA